MKKDHEVASQLARPNTCKPTVVRTSPGNKCGSFEKRVG